MRRGWAIAGALILAVAPAVPVVAADGMSLVIERLPGAGDVQRFLVRLDGVGKGAKVAVAASPAEALSEVTCAPETAGAGGAEVPASESAEVGLAAMGALAGGASAAPGVRVCALGKLAGERVVEVAVTAPAGVTDVVLAAVVKLRDPAGGELTMTRTAAVQKAPPRDEVTPPPADAGTTAHAVATVNATPTVRSGAPARAAAGHKRRGGEASRGTVTPQPLATVAPVATQGPVGLAPLPSLIPQVPQVSAEPLPALQTPQVNAEPLPALQAPQVSAELLPSVAPSARFSYEGGEAPWPWDMAMSKRPVEPVGWVSPIDGPRALPMVAAGIGVLLGALWLFVTVQRGGNRRKVL